MKAILISVLCLIHDVLLFFHMLGMFSKQAKHMHFKVLFGILRALINRLMQTLKQYSSSKY